MLTKGTRVRVVLPTSEQTISAAMKRFHGKVTRIESVTHKQNRFKTTYYVYTLEGCCSCFGNHYEFLEEWLAPYDESEVST